MAVKQAIPNGLGQRSARVEKHAAIAQQAGAQLAAIGVICFHGVGNHFKANGHVEIHGGRHFAQVAQGVANQREHGLAIVNVERAAVVEANAHVVVTAKRMIPWQPVYEHGRLV